MRAKRKTTKKMKGRQSIAHVPQHKYLLVTDKEIFQAFQDLADEKDSSVAYMLSEFMRKTVNQQRSYIK